MTASEKRAAVVAQYKKILGRNIYSQKLRDYCYKLYKGHYYSDCSSSISYAYKMAGEDFGILNTVGMYRCKDFTYVPVKIVAGLITNPSELRVGDMLLFAGGDSSRAYAGYVGHVEMIYSINGSTIKICGHGSGTPRVTDLNTYCRARYAKKADTPLKNRRLIKVVRFIQDDKQSDKPTEDTPMQTITVTAPTSANIRAGAGKGHAVLTTVKHGEKLTQIKARDGWVPVLLEGGKIGWIAQSLVEGAE